MKKIFVVFLLLLLPLVAQALDLKDAKARGLVGEKQSGYLGAVAPSPEVNALVERINDLRRQEYAKIAKKNNTPVSVVESISAKKAQDATPAGQYVEKNGKWIKK